MKINDVKHNHSLTDLLKVLIFSILMITPLLSVATRCLYVVCNKNAYQSAEITATTYDLGNEYQTNEVNTIDDLVNGNIYHFELDHATSNTFTLNTMKLYNTIISTSNGNMISYAKFDVETTPNSSNLFCISVVKQSDNVSIKTRYISNDSVSNITNNTYSTNGIKFDFIYNSNLTNDFTDTISMISESEFLGNPTIIETEGHTLDNVFEYSVNKLAESPILSWTQQTAIYTGVNAMTSQLGVNMPTIPMLITYWFLLTIIYVILDIVLKLFTILTHMIGGKKST